MSTSDRDILNAPIQSLVQSVHNGKVSPHSILEAYGKIAIQAQKKTNCLTEVMIRDADAWLCEAAEFASIEAESDAEAIPEEEKVHGLSSGQEKRRSSGGQSINLRGPLAGIPVSLKDSIAVGGIDTSVGYSCFTRQPEEQDGTLVKILKAAGWSH